MEVLAGLAAMDVRFVVTGGVAVVLHGCERAVPDLDIVVDPAPANLVLVMTCLARLGFWPTLPLPLSAVVVMRTVDAAGHEVDVNRLYAIPFEDLFQRSLPVALDGSTVRLISRSDLIAVKQRRQRDYDLTDLALLG